MSDRLIFPATIPVRGASEAELAEAARAALRAEPLDCDAVVMASHAILAGYAIASPDRVAEAVREAAAPGPEAALFERMWRSRHMIAGQALMAAGKLHPDKKVAKAARAALVKASTARNSRRGR
jgi:hypothetical protein